MSSQITKATLRSQRHTVPERIHSGGVAVAPSTVDIGGTCSARIERNASGGGGRDEQPEPFQKQQMPAVLGDNTG